MAFFHHQGADIYYEIKGEGKPLVLLAGLASDSQSWALIVPELAKHFKLIIPDNRGCGRTKCADEEITIENMARDTLALLDYLKVEKPHVVGHSMGGMIALKIAELYSEKLDRIVLAASASKLSQKSKLLLNDWVSLWKEGLPMDLWYRNLFYWIFSPAFFENVDFVNENVTFAMNYPWAQTLGQFRAQVATLCCFDMEKSLSRIQNRTLVLTGEHDILFPGEESSQTCSLLPFAESENIRQAAHSIFVEQPEAFISAVSEFLMK